MICIVDCGTEWLEKIEANIDELGYSCKVIKLSELECFKFQSFSGIIISGAPTLLSGGDLQKYMKLFKFIKTVSIPVLGICLGHEIIGLLYGSEVHKGKMINKKEKIEIVKQDDLFNGIENYSFFQEEHSLSITLPKKFNLLAKSETCDNEAMKYKYKKIYGTQFHPEMSDKNGKNLFRNFLNMCPKN